MHSCYKVLFEWNVELVENLFVEKQVKIRVRVNRVYDHCIKSIGIFISPVSINIILQSIMIIS